MKHTDILHELYYGSYEPESFGNSNSLTSQDRKVIEAENALKPALSPASEKLFETYKAAVSIRDAAVSEQAYKAGFRLAVRLIFSGFTEPERSEKD